MASKSKSKKKGSSPRALRPGIRFVLLLLTLGATGLSGYLAWLSFTGRNAVGCGPESGCAAVLNSRWAYWLGIPVSLLGGLTYFATFLGILSLGPKTPAPRQRKTWPLLLLLSWLIVGAALWFLLLQIIVIKQFCPFCLGTHATAFAAAVLLLRHCPYGRDPGNDRDRLDSVQVPASTVRKVFFPAAIGLALMAAGQLVAPKKTYIEHQQAGGVQITTNRVPNTNALATASSLSLTSNVPTATNEVKETGTSALSQAVPPSSSPPSPEPEPVPNSPDASEFRSISLFNGQLQFDLVDVPIIGNPQAPHVIIGLHDYTCSGCRAMHKPLMNVFRKYSNELAIVSLPLPLDSTCNPLVPKTPPAHVDACKYAKIGLAVWRANPAALAEFDDWVFAPERPPSVEETQRFARGLVGDQNFADAWNDPLVDRQLKIDIALYGLNYQMNKRSSMPQLFVGSSVFFGSMPEEELERKIVEEFGLSPRPD